MLIQGKDFCLSPDFGLGEEEILLCQNYITDFLPKIIASIFRFPDGIDNDGKEICNAFAAPTIC